MIRFALLLLALSVHAQSNLDLEKGTADGPLDTWFSPSFFAAYKVAWSTDSCAQGQGCIDLNPVKGRPAGPGNLMQSFNAEPFRGKRIRYRAAVNTAPHAYAELWLRVDRADGVMGFFDNMANRSIRTEGQWKYFEIDGFVHSDAKAIALGVLAHDAAVRFDDASITVTGDLPVLTTEGPNPLSAQGLRNLQAFAMLYGLVRHFHPSDQVAAADWNRIAIEGVRAAEGATDLATTLTEIFRPVAPTLRVFSGEPPPLELTKTNAMIRLQHKGFGQPSSGRYNAYTTARVPAQSIEFHTAPLGEGLTAIIPLALYKDENGTLPHAPKPPEPLPPALFNAADRATRLADVVIAWNIFQHFYPYFDVNQINWKVQLPLTLKQAAIDVDALRFQSTLRRMVAALKDGHGNVYANLGKPQGLAPVFASWIESKLIVTVGNNDVKVGDEIVAINGKPAAQRLAELEEEISSATPQWARSRSAAMVLSADRGAKLTLLVRGPSSSEGREVTVTCDARPPALADARPKTVTAELEPGLWYIDLTRASDKEFTDLLPQLEKASGIVFDMRGYPKVSAAWFSHISKSPMKSAQWHIPLIDRPGHMEFTRGGEWDLQPKAPYLAAKKVFLTDGGAISYAESTMGIVEAYKLGEIIGETTAGTNGNVNPFQLPGGYNVTWTGMKVLKHDGTRHHGVGIKPTIPLARTQAGVAAGRDELLERAVAVIKAAK